MNKLKIEAKHRYSCEGLKEDIDLTPENVTIKIFNGDELVAETTLDAMVKKFLIVSTQYMQAVEIINKIKENQEAKSKIILPGNQ